LVFYLNTVSNIFVTTLNSEFPLIALLEPKPARLQQTWLYSLFRPNTQYNFCLMLKSLRVYVAHRRYAIQ